jgi:hypothetical protein
MRIRKFYIFAALLQKVNEAKAGSVKIAQVAELVDALVSGTSIRKDVQVRVLFWAQVKRNYHLNR